MNDLTDFTDEELYEKRDQILKSSNNWKSSKDGSYEMTLESKGYYKIQNELKRRKEK